jgi:hypothetical protein
MAKLSKEDISRLEEKGITIGATVTCAHKPEKPFIVKSWSNYQIYPDGDIFDGTWNWLFKSKTKRYATVVKPAPSVQRKFKQGDIVLRGKHGTIPHKVTGYASDNIVTLTSCETGKPCQSHQDNIRLRWVRKAEKKRPEPIQAEQPKPEPTIDEQIEAARIELERLEKIKEREQPIEINRITIESNNTDVFIGLAKAPSGLETRCLMFKTKELEMRTQLHYDFMQEEYTILTFHRK